jgi:hypothetical protein
MQHRLKSAPGTAGAEIVTPQLFDKLDIAVNMAFATLDAGF